MTVRYYKTDSRKIRLGEWWRLYPSPIVLVPWLLKFIGLEYPCPKGIPWAETTKDLLIEKNTIPKNVLIKLDEHIKPIIRLGFSTPYYLGLKNSLMNISEQAFEAFSYHNNGGYMASIAYCRANIVEEVRIGFISTIMDGTIVGTSNKRGRFDPPPSFNMKSYISRPVEQLLEIHQKRVSELSANSSIRLLKSCNDILELKDEAAGRMRDYMVERGAWAEMTQDEIDSLQEGTS